MIGKHKQVGLESDSLSGPHWVVALATNFDIIKGSPPD